ncbi:hypothetical protein [Aquitalea magnusonii]|uniref:hypothetical protein n=1 Tax=Aquitalea magnusonii TaxID=332411 RepID=UPI0018755755|nr:hypothetical protein [Aquitalea magnusonii]
MRNQDFLFYNLHGEAAHCAKWFKLASLPKAAPAVRARPAADFKLLIFRNFGLAAASGRMADSLFKATENSGS